MSVVIREAASVFCCLPVPPPHHNKSCYLSSWYKLPRPIQACHKRAWEVHQPKEGNSANAEVTCHFLYSSNYDTSDLCPTYSALLTRVFSENTIFTWLNGSKITNKDEVQSEGWSVYSKITWKKKQSNLVIYTFLFYKIQMIYHQCCQWFTCKKSDFEIPHQKRWKLNKRRGV